MNLVDDINAVFSFRRGICHFVHNFTNIIDAVIRCRIYFYYIHASAFCNRLTGCALPAGASVHGMFAVDTFCKKLRNTRFTGTSCTAE